MKKEVTPEQCYNWYHIETNAAKNRRVRSIKNFDKARGRDDWSYFVSFARKCNRSAGLINARIFISVLAKHYSGWFHPKCLVSQKSIKIYKSHVKKQDLTTSDPHIKDNILKSLKYLIKYCKENDIDSFEEYFVEGMYVVPTIAKDLNSGNISKYLFACVPDAVSMLDTFPKDIKEEFFTEFIEEHSQLRMRVLSNKDKSIKDLSTNFSKIFKQLINKVKK
jgi:hypothetical protein